MRTLTQACRECREAISLDMVDTSPLEPRSAMEEHLAICADCRRYAMDLRVTTDGLRHLASPSVEPTPDFHARWTSAIEQADQPGPLARAVAAWLDRGWLTVWRNRLALATLTPVWILILALKLTAPDVGHVPSTTIARSPLELFRALKAENQTLIASGRWNREPAPAKVPAGSPRSSRAIPHPVTFRQDSETNPQTDFLS